MIISAYIARTEKKEEDGSASRLILIWKLKAGLFPCVRIKINPVGLSSRVRAYTHIHTRTQT